MVKPTSNNREANYGPRITDLAGVTAALHGDGHIVPSNSGNFRFDNLELAYVLTQN